MENEIESTSIWQIPHRGTIPSAQSQLQPPKDAVLHPNFLRKYVHFAHQFVEANLNDDARQSIANAYADLRIRADESTLPAGRSASFFDTFAMMLTRSLHDVSKLSYDSQQPMQKCDSQARSISLIVLLRLNSYRWLPCVQTCLANSHLISTGSRYMAIHLPAALMSPSQTANEEVVLKYVHKREGRCCLNGRFCRQFGGRPNAPV